MIMDGAASISVTRFGLPDSRADSRGVRRLPAVSTPPATLTAINPPQLYQGSNLRIEVQGEYLRPFMRVRFDTLQGRSFMIGGTRGAIVDLPDLDPGMYDVVLYDYMQEVSRLPKALTILPLAPVPTVEVKVAGAFKGLAAERLKTIKAGDRFLTKGELVAEVLSVGAPMPSSQIGRASCRERV
jgi:hypothetical protein